jgi:hypothetical protein
VFYRDRHCPQCQKQRADLDRKMDEVAKRGVGAVARLAVFSHITEGATDSATLATRTSRHARAPWLALEGGPDYRFRLWR